MLSKVVAIGARLELWSALAQGDPGFRHAEPTFADDSRAGKQRLHVAARQQVVIGRVPRRADRARQTQNLELRGSRQPAHEGQAAMRFEKERARWRLYPVRFRDSHKLIGKRALL